MAASPPAARWRGGVASGRRGVKVPGGRAAFPPAAGWRVGGVRG